MLALLRQDDFFLSPCTFVRRIAIIDGKERRYRMVLLNSGNFCFQ